MPDVLPVTKNRCLVNAWLIAMAIDEEVSVQRIDYPKLRTKLLDAGQVLARPTTPKKK